MAKNPIDFIGNTPMVPVRYLNPNPKVRFYLKLEKFNPGGSVKDRIAKYMIEDAKQRGLITKEKSLRDFWRVQPWWNY